MVYYKKCVSYKYFGDFCKLVSFPRSLAPPSLIEGEQQRKQTELKYV